MRWAAGEQVYSTDGMTLQKQRSDFFRHVHSRFGVGRPIVRTASADRAPHRPAERAIYRRQSAKRSNSCSRRRRPLSNRNRIEARRMTWNRRHLLGLEELTERKLLPFSTPPRISSRSAAASQEARRPQGQGRRQPVLRAFHADSGQLCLRGQAARRRHPRFHSRRLQRQQGRDVR